MLAPAPIEFWFDFSSPYAYFAALKVDALGATHGRAVLWRPFMLGFVLPLTGMVPMVQQHLRGDYARRDWDRLARLEGVPFALPPGFPLKTMPAARMFYAVEADDPARANAFARRLFEQTFGAGEDMSSAEAVADLGAAMGLDRAALLQAPQDQRWKDAIRARTGEAVQRGIFGAPFIIADGEPFWGVDRLPMADLWLQRGGW